MIEKILSMMNNVYSLDVLDAMFELLRRVNDLIDWNWDSNVELRLIAKISVLNELSLVESATRIWLISSQSAEKIFLFVCCSSSFQIFSLLFCQNMIFLLYRDVRADFTLWKHWNDVLNCMKKNVVNMTRKTSSRKILDRKKNFDLIIWIINDLDILMIQCWNWSDLTAYCSWNDQKYVKWIFLSFDVFLLDDLNLIDWLKQAKLVDLIFFFDWVMFNSFVLLWFTLKKIDRIRNADSLKKFVEWL